MASAISLFSKLASAAKVGEQTPGWFVLLSYLFVAGRKTYVQRFG
jgi:hypothetical protein